MHTYRGRLVHQGRHSLRRAFSGLFWRLTVSAHTGFSQQSFTTPGFRPGKAFHPSAPHPGKALLFPWV